MSSKVQLVTKGNNDYIVLSSWRSDTSIARYRPEVISQ
jgi:hypothetical protein